LKQYQQLLEKKTTEEETTLRHELDFEEKRKRKTLPHAHIKNLKKKCAQKLAVLQVASWISIFEEFETLTSI